MRSRRFANDQVAEVARRRLELLGAELASIRPLQVDPPTFPGPEGSCGPAASPAVAAAPPDAQHGPANGARQPGSGRHARRSVRRGAAGWAWVQDRLPPAVQGLRLGAAHLAFVAVLVAVVLGATAWWTVRAHDPGDLVPARSAAMTPGPSALVASGPVPAGVPAGRAPAPTPAEGTGSSAVIVVDVAGKVRRPGIARLPAGARVVDALEAAGGARRGVNLRSLNLARPLVDGEQVLVGVAVVPGVAASAAAVPGPGGAGAPVPLVSLNSADQAALETLPGVGPVTAQAILQWRAEHGSFTAVDELLDVSGIGEATLAQLAPLVTL